MELTTADFERQSSLDRMWSALIRPASKEIVSPVKTPTNPQGTAHVRYHKTEEGDTESGEGVGAAVTTTYGYDYSGNRVSQTTGSTTTIYPNPFESIISTVVGSTTYATSTDFINVPQKSGQSLPVAEIFQTLINGVATGTAKTDYVLTDNLGSVVGLMNASGTLDSYQGKWGQSPLILKRRGII